MRGGRTGLAEAGRWHIWGKEGQSCWLDHALFFPLAVRGLCCGTGACPVWSSGSRPSGLNSRHLGLAALQHVGSSSLTRDQTRIQSLHWKADS